MLNLECVAGRYQSFMIQYDHEAKDLSIDAFIDMMKNSVVTDAVSSYSTNITLTASGYYLNMIKELFTNIPMTGNSTVVWTGEIAKFMLLNLRIFAKDLQ